MTDQTIPADKVREIIEKMHDHANNPYVDSSEKRNIVVFADQLAALLPAPPHPTLADMTEEERGKHVGGQVDVSDEAFGGRAILTGFETVTLMGMEFPRALILTRDCRTFSVPTDEVTPRPGLPRLEWPGTEKPAPAPALPGGWRLADHEKHGRVIVTNDTPNTVGHVCFVLPATDPMGYDWLYCDPSELRYLDTTSAVQPNTMAVGSEWDDADALTAACRESGRDQIVVTDKDGDVSVWGQSYGWWEVSTPDVGYEPFTILHTGRGPTSE